MKEDWRTKKRSAEGSIKNVGPYMYARIQWVDQVSGKRKEKLRRATSRTEARKLIKEMVSELEGHGEDTLRSDKLTFLQLAREYESKKLVPATFSNGIKVSGLRSVMPLKSALKPLVEHFGRKAVRLVRSSEIEAYKVARLNAPVVIKKKTGDIERPRQIASVNREIELLRAIFNFAKNDGLILRSPFENQSGSLIVKGAETERSRILFADEEARLLAACGPRTTSYERKGKTVTRHDTGETRKHLKALIVAAVDTAARRGELFKLRWKDVDIFNRTITIQASNSKTERTRVLPMTSRVRFELESLWDASPKSEHELVFGIVSTVKNAWKTLCEEAHLDDLHFHDLRHTATTRMIRAGVPHTEVMKITGHTQMKTFLRYLNMTNESINNSADKLDAYLLIGQTSSGVMQVSDSLN